MRSLEDLTVPELLATARAATEKSQLFDTILSDPATRKEALALVKKRNPNMPIPELDAENAASSRRRRRAQGAPEARGPHARERDARAHRRAAHDRHDKYKLTDADLLEVEKIMTDETAPIPHYDAAVKVWRAQKSQAVPTSRTSRPPCTKCPRRTCGSRASATTPT
jgi:hypothetical protein